MYNIIPVILAGGEGNRLKPLSTKKKPKQFLKLSSGKNKLSLLQETAKRALQITDAKDIIVISSEAHKKIAIKQLGKIHKDLCNNVILEPCGKNTAMATSIAAIYAANNHSDPVLLIMPSDHLISDSTELIYSIKSSIAAAKRGHIVLFGINPTREDGNYGHIVQGDESLFRELFEVNGFIEKPDREKLSTLKKHDKKWWNSGMFLMSTRTFFSEMKKKNLDVLTKASNAYASLKESDYGYTINESLYSDVRSISIDKAIIEDSKKLLVKPVDIDWHDLGSWQSIWELSQKDGKGTPLENFLDKIAAAS
ncbi:MAG: sugar phosphate nucleotidyltransferase [Rickettsiales bacterium]|nr:sugar phosphate nucleotidyltransferase [Pseudomonadota bacterium]MDA0965777.1 sugar phosphate nucleotidyltransferase [Pseudomonadota bacterium]MDG4543761.1 sugar phosphate nucleotidyltransferase [Rickettsiales bacterium]MDG4545908.1 sugar phosphate nucleotidyltransferase [Rickettsiales bacterium]MDG4548154.1 sugar phosphate nucleotidyltransferase [Rickettsiales bacterium]